MTPKRIAMGVGLVLLVGGVAWWLLGARTEPAKITPGTPRGAHERNGKLETRVGSAPAREVARAPLLSPTDKAARVEKIRRDYDELRAKAALDYATTRARFPAGLNAFLQQLALLEREKRADLAAVLSERELEELEYRELPSGQLVQRLLGDTAATEEQRRAVFRLQREFDERFALVFDASPRAALERETARQELQEAIRGVVGDPLFAAWLKGEGADFANFTRFVTQQRLPEGSALELWRLKNDYTRRRLEVATQRLPPEQVRVLQSALARETQARVVGILGPAAMVRAQREVLGWLPAR